jgi:hypothetical protein
LTFINKFIELLFAIPTARREQKLVFIACELSYGCLIRTPLEGRKGKGGGIEGRTWRKRGS